MVLEGATLLSRRPLIAEVQRDCGHHGLLERVEPQDVVEYRLLEPQPGSDIHALVGGPQVHGAAQGADVRRRDVRGETVVLEGVLPLLDGQQQVGAPALMLPQRLLDAPHHVSGPQPLQLVPHGVPGIDARQQSALAAGHEVGLNRVQRPTGRRGARPDGLGVGVLEDDVIVAVDHQLATVHPVGPPQHGAQALKGEALHLPCVGAGDQIPDGQVVGRLLRVEGDGDRARVDLVGAGLVRPVRLVVERRHGNARASHDVVDVLLRGSGVGLRCGHGVVVASSSMACSAARSQGWISSLGWIGSLGWIRGRGAGPG